MYNFDQCVAAFAEIIAKEFFQVRLHLAKKIKMRDELSEDEGVTAAWRRLIIINYSCECY